MTFGNARQLVQYGTKQTTTLRVLCELLYHFLLSEDRITAQLSISRFSRYFGRVSFDAIKLVIAIACQSCLRINVVRLRESQAGRAQVRCESKASEHAVTSLVP